MSVGVKRALPAEDHRPSKRARREPDTPVSFLTNLLERINFKKASPGKALQMGADTESSSITASDAPRPALLARGSSSSFSNNFKKRPSLFQANRQERLALTEKFKQQKKLEEEREFQLQNAQGRRKFETIQQFRDFQAYDRHVLSAAFGDSAAPASPLKSRTILDQISRQKQEADVQRIKTNVLRTLNEPLPSSPLTGLKNLSLKEKELGRLIDRKAIPVRKFRKHLTPDELELVTNAFNAQDKVASIPGAEVRGKDAVRLKPGQWLNDEVINFYMVMINNRSIAHQNALKSVTNGQDSSATKKKRKHGPADEPLNVHAFTSFFYTKLTSATGYAGVRRWTKKVDVFEKDAILMPINVGNAHWISACINLREKRFECYDSMGHWYQEHIDDLRQWLQDEHMDKKKIPLNLDDWEDYQHPSVPQQSNGVDCGVFACQMMECCSRKDAPLDFLQENIPYLRQKMLLEIIQNKFIDEEWT